LLLLLNTIRSTPAVAIIRRSAECGELGIGVANVAGEVTT
jgi:hypothetical protein